MPPFRRSLATGSAALGALLTAGVITATLPAARAQSTATLTSLYSFSGSDGMNPEAALVQGSDGNFYGTTYEGGANGSGTVFVITPAGGLTTLHSFNVNEGAQPQGVLVQGSDGNFYGTTSAGGVSYDYGTVFQITPAGVLTTLHTFSGLDGLYPQAGLVQGSDGNFYGTTQSGGANEVGTVFQITPAGVLTTLYSFSGSDGMNPVAALVQGSNGNFYGTTEYGGTTNDGTVFEITPTGALTTLHNFSGSDGFNVKAGLVQGSDGNFYGTTDGGGADEFGTVFQITPAGVLTTLHSFSDSDGAYPFTNLVQGSDGNLYGTTNSGANLGGADEDGDGTIFEITPAGAFTSVYSFSGSNGQSLQGALVQGSDGNFYGATYEGGTANDGTVFKLTVGGTSSLPAFFTGETALANGVYYLAFPSGNYFGYYSFLANPAYIYHFDLGYEYVFDANDGKSGVYFYDFASSDFFYTSPSFPFPYLYDFGLQSTVYYYPDPNNAGHYNTDGIRYFYVFSTGKIISK